MQVTFALKVNIRDPCRGASFSLIRLTSDYFLCCCLPSQVAKDMMNHATDTALKEESFLSICDLLIMFAHVGEGGPKQTAHLAPLLYKADQSMGEFLNYFIQASTIPTYLHTHCFLSR